jgi:glycerophosphoryl diester phosphodiesterase
MKRALIFLLGGICVAALSVSLWPAPPAKSHIYFADAPSDRAEIIAHAAGQGHAPPNTLLALETAEQMGADVLEVDVQQTRDGVLILRHDDTLDRTTDLTGVIADMDWAEIAGADAGATWIVDGNSFASRDIKIPKLEEALATFPDARWTIEIKNDTPHAATAMCAEIKSAGAQSRVLVASFHDAAMATFRAACPAVATSASSREVRDFVIAARLGLSRFVSMPAVALQVPTQSNGLDLTHPRVMAAAQRRGIRIQYWTINDPAEIERSLAAGADGVMTDYVDRGRAALSDAAK